MLPKNFKAKQRYDLIRVGKDYDGGYAVERKSLYDAKSLISMGVWIDWSFEEDFISRNFVRVNAYDHTITKSFWIKSTIRSFINLFRFKINFSELISNILLYPKYLSFFNNKNNIHYIEKIGLQSKNEVTLRDCIQNKHIQAPIFLKIDIEGGEYRVLDELVEYSSMICGLAIEFHDVDLHQDRIELFLNEFPLTLVHTHPNNFGGVDKKGDPLVLEMSFSDSPDVTGDTPLYQYDQPNNPNIDELKLIV